MSLHVVIIGWFLSHKTENNNDPNTASINATEPSANAVSPAPNMTPTDATKAALDAATEAQQTPNSTGTLTELRPVSLTVSPDPQNLTQYGQQQQEQQQQQQQQQQQEQQQQQFSSKFSCWVTRVPTLGGVTTVCCCYSPLEGQGYLFALTPLTSTCILPRSNPFSSNLGYLPTLY